MGRVLINDGVADRPGTVPGREPMELHRRLPGYQVTPLRELSALAQRLGVGEILVKDESLRLNLPAFKILGASWATYKTLLPRLGVDHPQDLDELVTLLEPYPCVLVTASEGNHGRALARMARLLDVPARIFLPVVTAGSRVAAIEEEGAEVVMVNGDYDQAVATAAAEEGPETLVIQDQSWEGYEEIPHLVTEGYSTIFWEIEDQLAASGKPGPDLVFVQIGVGAFASAVIRHYGRPGMDSAPRIVGVEPSSAACALAACEAGRVVQVPGPHDSIMTGLNCGVVGSLAWPLLRNGIDAFVTVDNDRCVEALRCLEESGLAPGETGAAGLAGVLELLAAPKAVREQLGLDRQSRVLVIVTEGTTGASDPENRISSPLA